MRIPIRNYLFVLVISVFTLNSFGQGITISNGEKKKRFGENSYYDITLRYYDSEMDTEYCCNNTRLTGTISYATKDSVTVQLEKIEHEYSTDQFTSLRTFQDPEIGTEISLSTKDIYYLKQYSSKNNFKLRKNIGPIGGVLILTSIVTAANSFLVKNKTGKRNVLLSAGIQFGLGLTAAIIGDTKKYHFKRNNTIWYISE